MAKNIKWLVVALAVLGILGLSYAFYQAFSGPSAKYLALKATYDQAVKDAAAQHALDLSTIVLNTESIALKDAAIAEKEAKVTRYVGKASTLAAELAALRNAEPIQPELETQPLVINLRAQIGNLTQALSISAGVIENKDGIISDWSAKFDAQAKISEAWKRAYNDEHRLRLLSEDLNKSLEHQGRVSRLYGKVSMAALAGAGVYLVINAISK